MNPKTHIGTLFVISVILSGCGTEKNVYRLPLDSRSEERFEKRFEWRRAKVVLANGQQIQANGIHVHDDTVSYRLGASDSVESIHATNIARIETVNRSKGLGRGLGYGALFGASTGLCIALISGDGDKQFFKFDTPTRVLVTSFGLGVVGGIIGMIGGSISGVREVHTFSDSVNTDGDIHGNEIQERK